MLQTDQIKKLQDKVEHCLQIHPDTRNSDITLTIAIWRTFHADKLLFNAADDKFYVRLDMLFELPREDNIKRIRARLQSAGKFLPTVWEVANKRQIQRQVWEEYMGYYRKIRDDAEQMEMEMLEDQEELSVCCGAPVDEGGFCLDCREYGREV